LRVVEEMVDNLWITVNTWRRRAPASGRTPGEHEVAQLVHDAQGRRLLATVPEEMVSSMTAVIMADTQGLPGSPNRSKERNGRSLRSIMPAWWRP
jgi:hypothetical protein